MRNSLWNQFIQKSPGYFVLLDPDKIKEKDLKPIVKRISNSKAIGILIGTSLLLSPNFDQFVKKVKKYSTKPVVIFPGGCYQLSRYADGILFITLLSGRNPQYLIGDQVKAASLIYHYGLETIPTGYMLIASGGTTSVEFISNTVPIPRDKPDIMLGHALAGYFLGLKLLYLDAGSGAKKIVPKEFVQLIKKNIETPIMVGGGIEEASKAKELIDSGADFVVIGNILERDFKKIEDFDKVF